MTTPLNRSTAQAAPAAPVRIVHLGLGAFHRAHQAWYTQHASDGAEWGIAAFTGRRPDAAIALSAQDGLYTLIERGESADTLELVSSIVQAHDGADLPALCALVAAPTTAMVTLTITEAAYNLAPDGSLDRANLAVQADLSALHALIGAGKESEVPATRESSVSTVAKLATAQTSTVQPSTAGGRLVLALDARRRAGSGPLAIVSCDNLANNAAAARAAVGMLAQLVDPELGNWIAENVSFVGTSVDRITPRTTEAELALVAQRSGFSDSSPVVTEPFHDWVLSGDFPAGRPDWGSAGALFVEKIEDFENRKLWLLNGAHSLMAYAGQLRGHTTVAQALADPSCAAWIDELWDEAEYNLPSSGLDIPAYRAALLERFGNARIAHHLAQIAMDGSSKLRMRAVPVFKAELAAGRSGEGAARMIAAWVAYVTRAHSSGTPIEDASEGLEAALAMSEGSRLRALLSLLDADLSSSPAALTTVARQLDVVSRPIVTNTPASRTSPRH